MRLRGGVVGERRRNSQKERLCKREEQYDDDEGVSDQCESATRRATYEVPESSAAVIAVPSMMLPLKAIPSIAIDQKASETTGFQELEKRVSFRFGEKGKRSKGTDTEPTYLLVS